MIWPAGWRWCRRLIEFLIAIIFAKVFIVAIINLAAAGLARGGLGDKFEGVMAGGALPATPRSASTATPPSPPTASKPAARSNTPGRWSDPPGDGVGYPRSAPASWW
jgi:hypothetical protein